MIIIIFGLHSDDGIVMLTIGNTDVVKWIHSCVRLAEFDISRMLYRIIWESSWLLVANDCNCTVEELTIL